MTQHDSIDSAVELGILCLLAAAESDAFSGGELPTDSMVDVLDVIRSTSVSGGYDASRAGVGLAAARSIAGESSARVAHHMRVAGVVLQLARISTALGAFHPALALLSAAIGVASPVLQRRDTFFIRLLRRWSASHAPPGEQMDAARSRPAGGLRARLPSLLRGIAASNGYRPGSGATGRTAAAMV